MGGPIGGNLWEWNGLLGDPRFTGHLGPHTASYGAWPPATKAMPKGDLGVVGRAVPILGWPVRAAGRFVGK